jgi:hypothetical protein
MWVADVLFHVVLACLRNALSNLKAHLRGGIVDEASEAWAKRCVCTLAGLLGLVRIAITIGRLLLLRDWRWRRSHHRNGRDMLGNRVVEGRGLRRERGKC